MVIGASQTSLGAESAFTGSEITEVGSSACIVVGSSAICDFTLVGGVANLISGTISGLSSYSALVNDASSSRGSVHNIVTAVSCSASDAVGRRAELAISSSASSTIGNAHGC